jgi:hypothetical protein
MGGHGFSEQDWEKADAWYAGRVDRVADKEHLQQPIEQRRHDLVIIKGNSQEVFDLDEIIRTLNDACMGRPFYLEQRQEIRDVFEAMQYADSISVETGELEEEEQVDIVMPVWRYGHESIEEGE